MRIYIVLLRLFRTGMGTDKREGHREIHVPRDLTVKTVHMVYILHSDVTFFCYLPSNGCHPLPGSGKKRFADAGIRKKKLFE